MSLGNYQVNLTVIGNYGNKIFPVWVIIVKNYHPDIAKPVFAKTTEMCEKTTNHWILIFFSVEKCKKRLYHGEMNKHLQIIVSFILFSAILIIPLDNKVSSQDLVEPRSIESLIQLTLKNHEPLKAHEAAVREAARLAATSVNGIILNSAFPRAESPPVMYRAGNSAPYFPESYLSPGKKDCT